MDILKQGADEETTIDHRTISRIRKSPATFWKLEKE